MDPRLSPLKGVEAGGIHLDIFRENTEGVYVNLGGRFKPDTPDEVAGQTIACGVVDEFFCLWVKMAQAA